VCSGNEGGYFVDEMCPLWATGSRQDRIDISLFFKIAKRWAALRGIHVDLTQTYGNFHFIDIVLLSDATHHVIGLRDIQTIVASISYVINIKLFQFDQ
jgi:hypothetical protein